MGIDRYGLNIDDIRDLSHIWRVMHGTHGHDLQVFKLIHWDSISVLLLSIFHTRKESHYQLYSMGSSQ